MFAAQLMVALAAGGTISPTIVKTLAMSFDATRFLILSLVAMSSIWLWRFSSLLRKTPRHMRAAALRGSATAMGTEFWKQGSPYQNELPGELGIDPNSIVHTLRWPNPQVEIFSFQEVRHGTRGRSFYQYWVGYRFGERAFPKFDLRPAGMVSFIRRGWWRKVSLPGQIDFASRYIVTGEDAAAIEQFFTPDRCAAILAREWPRSIGMKAGGHWLLAHREQFFHATSESDSEASVAEEMQEVAALVSGMLPVAEALGGARLVEPSQQYAGRAQGTTSRKRRPWRSELVVLFSAACAIAVSIILAIVYLGTPWARFDQTILKTEPRRYLFAILLAAALWGTGERIIRAYQNAKQRAATRLETQFSVFPDKL